MTGTFRAACVQTNSSRDIAPSVDAACELVRAARGEGADLILLPENVSMLEPRSRLIREKAAPEDEHPALEAFRDLARETGAWLLVGSLSSCRAPGVTVTSISVKRTPFPSRSVLAR